MFNYFVLLLVCDLKTTRVLLLAFVCILSNITLYSVYIRYFSMQWVDIKNLGITLGFPTSV